MKLCLSGCFFRVTDMTVHLSGSTAINLELFMVTMGSDRFVNDSVVRKQSELTVVGQVI